MLVRNSWHWIWLESGKPTSRGVSDVMRRTIHCVQYTVLCYKKYIQKQKLVENMTKIKEIWTCI